MMVKIFLGNDNLKEIEKKVIHLIQSPAIIKKLRYTATLKLN